ncbi:DUF1656 domain-containing protein [Pseudoduganella sp. SL102]|uniref:DUF1656 domain-containing protein n=1 Tax=Pseudoduganella sp. SL102 TaxID=2995154 RepID=UPI00248B52D6|nr:DUF1656 domain-containing protein [Pseudoduganella sp. SL102]WBS05276.1 DUF1656 domain-containing protein [Pseudoduganella sp. SL102]
MSAEISLHGLYVPTLLLLALAALAGTRVLGKLLLRLGFYRLVWHPALFDCALFGILLGGLSILATRFGY